MNAALLCKPRIIEYVMNCAAKDYTAADPFGMGAAVAAGPLCADETGLSGAADLIGRQVS
ncbi:hypothetical protein [Rhizobium leguminosarum]|uniref:hypothetical protein n=1 Tax=Rhizobium leguminosarum TaxID=384 RepID=UPI003F992D0E